MSKSLQLHWKTAGSFFGNVAPCTPRRLPIFRKIRSWLHKLSAHYAGRNTEIYYFSVAMRTYGIRHNILAPIAIALFFLGAVRIWFCRLLAGANGNKATVLLFTSLRSPPHGPVSSGTHHHYSQVATNNTERRKYPLFAALVVCHFLLRGLGWEQGLLKAEVGQGLWWDAQPAAGGWNHGQWQLSIKPYPNLGLGFPKLRPSFSARWKSNTFTWNCRLSKEVCNTLDPRPWQREGDCKVFAFKPVYRKILFFRCWLIYENYFQWYPLCH